MPTSLGVDACLVFAAIGVLLLVTANLKKLAVLGLTFDLHQQKPAHWIIVAVAMFFLICSLGSIFLPDGKRIIYLWGSHTRQYTGVTESVQTKYSNEFLLIGYAHAQQNGELMSIGQRQARSYGPDSSFGFAIYIGDVHLRAPNEIVVFENSPEYRGFVDRDVWVSKEDFLRLVKGNIINEGALKIDESLVFSYRNKRYKITLDRIRWHVVGSDSVEILVEPI